MLTVSLYSSCRRSSRNRRKAEHKKWSLKEGSPFEDCALIDAIAKIITATDTMRGQNQPQLMHCVIMYLSLEVFGFSLVQMMQKNWNMQNTTHGNLIVFWNIYKNVCFQAYELRKTHCKHYIYSMHFSNTNTEAKWA